MRRSRKRRLTALARGPISRLSSAHLIALLALFVALGGSAVAVTKIPPKSVGTAQLKRGAVKAPNIARAAVKRNKIAPRAIDNSRIAFGAVNGPKITNGAVNRSKLAPGAVDASRLAEGAVGSAALQAGAVGRKAIATGAVSTANLANNSVTRAKISEGSLPLLATLRAGQTLRGMFAISASGSAGASEVSATDAQSFAFPMRLAPELHVVDATAGAPTPSEQCPGISGGNLQTPQAAPGMLCVYLRNATGEGPEGGMPTVAVTPPAEISLTRLGFSLTATFNGDGGTVIGQWAATAK